MTLITHNHILLASCSIRPGSSCAAVQGHVTLGYSLHMAYFTVVLEKWGWRDIPTNQYVYICGLSKRLLRACYEQSPGPRTEGGGREYRDESSVYPVPFWTLSSDSEALSVSLPSLCVRWHIK